MDLNLKLDFKKKEKGSNKMADNILVFIIVLTLIFAGLITATVFGVKEINTKIASIETAKEKYQQNQLAIDNLKALQRKSSEYEKQRDEYDALIPKEFNAADTMRDMEKRAEDKGCILTAIEFGEKEAPSGKVNQKNVKITVAGDFNDLMKFVDGLVHDKEFMRVDAINLKGDANNKMTVAMTVVKFFKNPS
ncbi:MAG: type 4a pilus biogenesis protein PilO [Oscillospiraceae bacterium]